LPLSSCKSSLSTVLTPAPPPPFCGCICPLTVKAERMTPLCLAPSCKGSHPQSPACYPCRGVWCSRGVSTPNACNAVIDFFFGGGVKKWQHFTLSGFPLQFSVRGHTRQRCQAQQHHCHFGAACATALVGRVVGLPLGGCVGGLLVIPCGLTPGFCFGVSGLPIGPLWVAPFDGLLKTGLVLGFNVGTRLACHFAFAVGHGAIQASCGEGKSLLVGHAG
jgi:hypothetical protein